MANGNPKHGLNYNGIGMVWYYLRTMSRAALTRTILSKSGVAPAPLVGGLGEPLLSKNDHRRNSNATIDDDEEEEETNNDSWSSLGMILGTVVLGGAGWV